MLQWLILQQTDADNSSTDNERTRWHVSDITDPIYHK